MSTKNTNDAVEEIMAERKETKELARQVFNSSLTVDGLKKLQKRYPKKLVVDMTNEAEFKQARKTRTERNNLTKAVNDKRIAFGKDVKSVGDNLIVDINKIYDVIITPFEKEDKRRKDAAEKAENEKQEILKEQMIKITGIKNMVLDSVGKDSAYIQNSIEGVDLIEPEAFHQELIHEVIEVKKDTLTALTINLNDALAREKLDEERLKLDKEREEMQAKQAKVDRDAKIEVRINNLKMIPVNFFDKTSLEVSKKIDALSGYFATEKDFAERVDEVNEAISNVIRQLSNMVPMKQFNEAQSEKEAEKLKQDKEEEKDLSYVETKKPVMEVSRQYVRKPVDIEPEMQVVSETLGEEISESFVDEPENNLSVGQILNQEFDQDKIEAEVKDEHQKLAEIIIWLTEIAYIPAQESEYIADAIAKGIVPHVQIIK